jgi:hypothetical protein
MTVQKSFEKAHTDTLMMKILEKNTRGASDVILMLIPSLNTISL